jgi:hypothetical protein
MRLKCALLYSLLLVTSVAAADVRIDGNWWRDLPPQLKAIYLAGYTGGYAEAASSSIDYVDVVAQGAKDQKACAPYFAAVRGALVDSSVGGIKLGTLTDGLDSFYGDYRNRSIRVAHAVPFVVRAIKGESDESLRPSIEAARKLATYE